MSKILEMSKDKKSTKKKVIKENGVTNHDLFKLTRVLADLSTVRKSAKFAYASTVNMKKLKPMLMELNALQQPSADFVKFDQERVALCEEHCLKDDKGEPIITENNYTFKDRAKVEKLIEKHVENSKEVLEAKRAKEVELQEFLDTEVSIDLHKVDISEVPDCTDQEMLSLALII